jgi:hypothetical protein
MADFWTGIISVGNPCLNLGSVNKKSGLYSVFSYQSAEEFKRSIIGPLGIFREETGGQFSHFKMITYTVTACPFA